MVNALDYWLRQSADALTPNLGWMVWNTFLALIPLGLSGWLFRSARPSSRRPALLWWLGLVTFIVFLPNAPYVLTDVIHLVNDIRWGYSIWVISLVLVPAYLLFMAIGFGAYVLSVIRLGRYLHHHGWRKRTVVASELTIHGLCAVGIYLGRFRRFNSWDLFTQLDTVVRTTFEHLMHQRPLVIVIATFAVISSLYWLCKQIMLALAWYWPNRHKWAWQLPRQLHR